MNKIELAHILEREGFRSDAYDINRGDSDECYCLIESNGVWLVFYSERGQQTGKTAFACERDACIHLLHLLRSDGAD